MLQREEILSCSHLQVIKALRQGNTGSSCDETLPALGLLELTEKNGGAIEAGRAGQDLATKYEGKMGQRGRKLNIY